MMTIIVEVAGQRFDLDGSAPLNFGRDVSFCDVALGVEPFDPSISRWAGSLDPEDGLWWITNRSTSCALHVVDVETGLGVPLPVTREGWPPARQPIDRQRLTILLFGAVRTHALAVTAPPQASVSVPRPAFVDLVPTQSLLPHLTDKQREALVALAEPYLRPFPLYRPEPRTYEEAGRRLGLPGGTVRRRVEDVRTALIERGVAGLDTGDARRNLVEWILANRLITPGDVEWLEQRLRDDKRSEET